MYYTLKSTSLLLYLAVLLFSSLDYRNYKSKTLLNIGEIKNIDMIIQIF